MECLKEIGTVRYQYIYEKGSKRLPCAMVLRPGCRLQGCAVLSRDDPLFYAMRPLSHGTNFTARADHGWVTFASLSYHQKCGKKIVYENFSVTLLKSEKFSLP